MNRVVMRGGHLFRIRNTVATDEQVFIENLRETEIGLRRSRRPAGGFDRETAHTERTDVAPASAQRFAHNVERAFKCKAAVDTDDRQAARAALQSPSRFLVRS